MNETHFINNKKQLRSIISKLKLGLHGYEEDKLVIELYNHIEYTRMKSYGNGYEQGKFDKEMDLLVENSRPPFRFRSET